MARARTTHWSTLLLLPLLAACAVGPDFTLPPPPPDQALGPPPPATVEVPGPAGAIQQFQPRSTLSALWWQMFRSPELNLLIDQSLTHNADLAAAQAALRAAHETAAANLGVFYPTLDGGISALRQKDPTGAVAPTAANNAPLFNLYTPQLTISYVADLWGGNRRTQESLEAQAEAQRFQAEATYLSLTANVVVAAIIEASLRDQLTATHRMVALQQQSLDIMTRQVALGQIGEADRLAQESALAQLQQTVPPLEKQWEQQRHQLAALLGNLPADPLPATVTLEALTLPSELPTALPSRLVEQRPDIRMAEANLHAASALIGVAIANRLPALTLQAGAGSSATMLQGLFQPGNGFWSIGAGASQPLFDGFALLHKERAARAAYDQAAAQYRGTVITALQNVADCLTALQTDARLLAAATKAERAAAATLAINRLQQAQGAVGTLSLLAAEQASLQAQSAVITARSGRLADTAALFQALGGGWWNRPPDDDR